MTTVAGTAYWTFPRMSGDKSCSVIAPSAIAVDVTEPGASCTLAGGVGTDDVRGGCVPLSMDEPGRVKVTLQPRVVLGNGDEKGPGVYPDALLSVAWNATMSTTTDADVVDPSPVYT